ncbi:MAG: SMC-Scp complex subunit ScpB [Clostridia bacterium]|nr:SMC-Scp complex subunit ScpB [Clostridia bacterium]
METKRYLPVLEAVLFASGEPVEVSRLAEALELDEKTVRVLAEDLISEYSGRGSGISIVRLDDAYQMCSNRNFADYVRRAIEIRRNTPLSQAAMEVLAIVAYNQPVTRAFIEQVRGVDCSAVMQGLIAKSLVEEKGRLELPGRPLLYGTTADFLRSFGLSSLDELPPIPQAEGVDAPSSIMEDTLEDIVEMAEQAKRLQEQGEPDAPTGA